MRCKCEKAPKIEKLVIEKIEVLRQELVAKKKHVESLNQMEYQLETVHKQLKRDKFQITEEEEEEEQEVEEEEEEEYTF